MNDEDYAKLIIDNIENALNNVMFWLIDRKAKIDINVEKNRLKVNVNYEKR